MAPTRPSAGPPSTLYRHYVRVADEVLMVDAAAPVEPGPVTVREAAKPQVYAAE